MVKSISGQTLWGKRLEVQGPKQGPLADDRQRLLLVLKQAKRFGILRKTGRNTYEWEHRNYYPLWSTTKVTVAIQVNFADNQVQVAMNDHSNPNDEHVTTI
jgi:hypothetical protein